MKREKIEDVLLKIGIPVRNKGFIYIVDAMEIFDEKGILIGMNKGLYQIIAEKRGATSSKVERCIRHAFNVARVSNGDYEKVNHYIGFIHCTNTSSLRQLYMMLKREEEDAINN